MRHESERSVRWKWDTKYAGPGEYGHPDAQVCRAVAAVVMAKLRNEGFEVETLTEGHRYAPVDADGNTIGESGGSYGGLEVRW